MVNEAPQLLSAWTIARSSRPIQSEPGSLRENGHVESCNGKLRDEVSDRWVFHTLRETQVLAGQYRLTTASRRIARWATGRRPRGAILPAEAIPMLDGLRTFLLRAAFDLTLRSPAAQV